MGGFAEEPVVGGGWFYGSVGWVSLWAGGGRLSVCGWDGVGFFLGVREGLMGREA